MIAAPSYVGRFAPSPTGPLHAGSLVTALASWLDARVHGGRWLVRFEDTDLPRNVPGAEAHILSQLTALGLHPDAPPWRQSDRVAQYAAALARLRRNDRAYRCACSRSVLAGAPHPAYVAPAHCGHGLSTRSPAAWRVRTLDRAHALGDTVVAWTDRRLGASSQNVTRSVGDFVLRRADGIWAYQIAVVVDDAAQGVTHIVRGADLADNTPRQIHLQRLLGAPTPVYFHGPLVLSDDGQKLSKQTGASALDVAEPLVTLRRAGEVLGLHVSTDAPSPSDWLRQATASWRTRWLMPCR